VTGSPHTGSIHAHWKAPASGGAPTSYTASLYQGDVLKGSCTDSTLALLCNINNLPSLQTYVLKVTASNASGTGPSSAGVNVTTK
jgi:hypothetical protein